MDTIFRFILVTAIGIGFMLAFFLGVGLIFNSKSTKEFLSEYIDWVKAIPGGILAGIFLGIFWMIPIMLIIAILDLGFCGPLFVGIGIVSRLFLIFLALFFILLWYSFGYARLPRSKSEDEDESI